MIGKPDWTKYLHTIRKKEVDTVFSLLPQTHFVSGLEIGAGDGFQTTLLASHIERLVSSDLNFNRIKESLKIPSVEYKTIDADAIEGIFDDNSKVEVRDFILNPPQKLFKAIVANPPYIRHHRLSLEQKNQFRKISLVNLGSTLDRRAGLHIYFLIQALTLLDKGGRLAFIMPADTCEGVFSKKLWSWISKKYCIDGVITFEHKATPFPGVDTNAVIFLVKNEKIKPA